MADLSPRGTLAWLADAGISMRVEGTHLDVTGPADALTRDMAAAVVCHKETFIEHWRCRYCDEIVSVLYGFEPDVFCRDCFEKIKGDFPWSG